MILGYHYHVPVLMKKGIPYIPSYIGVFLEELAVNAGELVLFAHEEPNPEGQGYDMALTHPQIRLVNMGIKTPAWDRVLKPSRHIERISRELEQCDHVLLRAPSPLAPYISRFLKGKVPCSFLLVGDYDEGVKHLNQPFFRKWAIILLLRKNQRDLSKAIRGQKILVNSAAIKNRYQDLAHEITVVNTSSIHLKDFYQRNDTCQTETIKLVFTGRFDFAKGLKELFQAWIALRKQGRKLELHLAGWEDYPDKPVQNALLKIAGDAGVEKFVHFHGKLKVGDELNAMYRTGDIYVLPSYFEGFPRSIWEAMANGLPVITCPVGGIPHILNNDEHALLVPPKDSAALQAAIVRIIEDETLRKRLISSGGALAKGVSLEVQTKKIIETITNSTN